MGKYFVIRNKETGSYFRGKGANRWGKYHNQASVYRMKAHAENTLGWLLQHGEPVEIVPIQIVENPNDIVEAVRCKDCKYWRDSWVAPDGKHEHGYCYMEDADDVIVGRWGDDFCSYGERRTNEN